MKKILVGIDGSSRGEKAMEWAARDVQGQDAQLTLLCVGDPDFAKEAGVAPEKVEASIEAVLEAAKEKVLARYPDLKVETLAKTGAVIDTIVDEANQHDAVVLGTHHGSTVSETITGAKGLRVSISTTAPTVVVPFDWEPKDMTSGIMVAVAADDSSDSAIIWAANHAVARNLPIDLVSAWGLPSYLTRPAEAMGGGIDPVGEQFQRRLNALVDKLRDQYPTLSVTGESIEGPTPSATLVEYSKKFDCLVMGTHSRSTLGRMVFGSITHSVLMNIAAPTIIVPQP